MLKKIGKYAERTIISRKELKRKYIYIYKSQVKYFTSGFILKSTIYLVLKSSRGNTAFNNVHNGVILLLLQTREKLL